MSQASVEKQAAVTQQAAQAKEKKKAVQVEVAPEQISYANLLFYCSWAGIGMLALTFFVYMSGILRPFIPPNQMPRYWGMSAHEFLVETGAPVGWGWLGMLGRGDYLNLLGIAFLALLTIIGYLFLLLPAYLRKKDVPYATIVALEITVLVLAASGILAVGAH